jgi:hypothetical protein
MTARRVLAAIGIVLIVLAWAMLNSGCVRDGGSGSYWATATYGAEMFHVQLTAIPEEIERTRTAAEATPDNQ